MEIAHLLGIEEKDNSFSNGQIPNQVKIFPREVGVRVTQVLNASHSIGELVGDHLG